MSKISIGIDILISIFLNINIISKIIKEPKKPKAQPTQPSAKNRDSMIKNEKKIWKNLHIQREGSKRQAKRKKFEICSCLVFGYFGLRFGLKNVLEVKLKVQCPLFYIIFPKVFRYLSAFPTTSLNFHITNN